MRSLFLIGFSVLFFQAKAQLITGVEYFYDTDPGIGNGTFISVTPTASLDASLSFPVGALSYGNHILGLRAKYSTNVWSTTHITKVFRMDDFPVVNAEYFLDTDPGLSNGIPISFPVVSGAINGTFAVPIPLTTNIGTHTLVIRTKTPNRFFSLNEARKFTVRNDSSLDSSEYFIDVDPGVGNGIPISFPLVANTINGTFPVPIPPAITTGAHTLVIRTKTPGSFFSHNEARKFTIRNNFVYNTIEYFIDADPGVGNGNFITIGGATVNQLLGQYSFNNTLTDEHILGFRTKTSNGNYSLTTTRKFFGKTRITTNEYFIDTDPGLGNGTLLPVSPNVDSLDITTLFPETGLTSGVHILVIRYKTLSGKWTLSEARPFTVDLLLAVELLTFSGQKTTHGNVLNWTTETEKDNAYFELMSSTDAIDFKTIASIPTKAVNGNSNTALNYAGLDSFPPNAVNYYKLKIVDIFGEIEYSRIIQLDNRNGLAIPSITVFSSNQTIQIFSKEELGESKINIYDISGKLILSKNEIITTDRQTNIALGNIARGIYIVQITTSTSPSYSYKLFIE